MKNGCNQYAPMSRIIELREAIALKFKVLYQSSYCPEKEIVVTVGTTQVILQLFPPLLIQMMKSLFLLLLMTAINYL